MQYRKIFNPQPLVQDFRNKEEKDRAAAADRRDGKLYCYDEEIVLRINVALATGRPLLVRGPSGCGKSSLAYNIARVMGRRYYEKVITARDQARDLLWRFDAVRRLGDAQARSGPRSTNKPDAITEFASYYPYIEPEVLWWVFDRNSAQRRGLPADRRAEFDLPLDPQLFDPNPDRDPKETQPDPCVVLIDEIDKADPDVPNDLLVPLGCLEFTVDEIERRIHFDGKTDQPPDLNRLPLVVITSNDERRLPPAFLRRCIHLEIADPKADRLIEIAKASEGAGKEREVQYKRVLTAIRDFRAASDSSDPDSDKAPCSIAEFLDAVRACLRLDDKQNSQILESIIRATTWKRASTREPVA